MESDYPALADALAIAGSTVRMADVTERSRVFFHSLGIRPLTSLAGVGTPVFGDSSPAPLWFKPHHRDLLLGMLRRPLFCRALHELSVQQRYLTLGFHPVTRAELGRRIEGIAGLNFLEAIVREYRVGAQTARVPVEAGVRDGIIGLVKPRTKLDFQQLVAQALAEVAGADNVASARTLSAAFLPLVLCRTAEDMRVYMERMGVDMRGWSDDPDDEFALDEDREDAGEEILRQVLQGLNTATRERDEAPSSSSTAASLGSVPTVQPQPEAPPAPAPAPTPPSPAPPIFALPDLGEVTMTITPANERPVQSRVTQGGWSGGSYGGWTPRSPAQAERDQDVGRRGEELVYRMEIERMRAMGHERPEDLVVWTSQADPGADHDIKSVGEDNQVRWIEVKSTTGTDGRFEWSRKEFEKALREGDRYELWRVYLAATNNPVAKRFANPAALLGASRLVLELGSLRAYLEDLG